jgi:hypothetical protein
MHKNDNDEPSKHLSEVNGSRRINSTLDMELVKHVFELSDETRAKLLAFLHLVEEGQLIGSDLHIDPAGQIALRLFSQEQPEGSRSGHENAAEPFQ